MNFFFKLVFFLGLIAAGWFFQVQIASVIGVVIKSVFLDLWFVWLALSLFALYSMGHPKPK